MKIDARKVRPCDSCGAKYGPSPFYVVAVSLVIPNANAINATVGLNIALGGGAFGIAEALSPDTEYLIVAGEKEPELWTTLWLCQECQLKPICLAEIAELVANKEASRATP